MPMRYYLSYVLFLIVAEHQATSVGSGTRLFVLGQWPQASTPFRVRYKIKVVRTSEMYSMVLLLNPNGQIRIPACYLIRNELSCYFRVDTNLDYERIAVDVQLPLNVYTSIEIQHVYEDAVWKIKWFINGSLQGQLTNQIPATTYTNVKVDVAKSEDGAIFYIKDFELEKVYIP